MSDPRSYGDAVAHSFHLRNTSHLVTQSLKSAQMAMTLLNLGPRQFGLSPRIPPEDTFIVAIYLTPVPDHELLSRGRTFIRQGYRKGAVRIVNLTDDFSARITSAHQSLVLYLPRQALDEFTADAELRKMALLSCEAGIVDPILAQLAETLLPALKRPGEASQLFVNYIALAACAHLTNRYGDSQPSPITLKGGL